jgi:hypothetical protein
MGAFLSCSTLTIAQHTPVEPFGGTNDYDVSDEYIVYTTKDPELPEACHTKQNVRISNSRVVSD